MPTKVQVKSVADVSTLQAVRPELAIATPVIPAGHPNEARMAAQLNLAQLALTYGQLNDALAQANFAGSVKGWRP